ncbi:alpha/beta hydrolase [soil metagenome]
MAKRNSEPPLVRVIKWLFPRLEKIAPFITDRIFRLAFIVPARYKSPAKEIAAANEATLSIMVVAGKRVQIYSWGDESHPYVLLVHGWAGRATQFRKFIAPLKQAGYRVIGFDGPAHGKSEGRATSMRGFEESLIKIFAKYSEPEAIVTHSFGGGAVLYAGSRGLKFPTLINIATPYVEEEIFKTYLRALGASSTSMQKFKDHVVKSEGHPFVEFTGSHTIKLLPAPIRLLLIQDEEDTEVPIINAEALLKIYPSATLHRTKGLGHTRILKDDRVILECVAFIRRGDHAS